MGRWLDDIMMNSESLRQEEEAIRDELIAFCQRKLRNGTRPVPLHVAFRIMSKWTIDPDKYRLR